MDGIEEARRDYYNDQALSKALELEEDGDGRVSIEVYVTHPSVKIPEFKTDQAACFDLVFNASGKTDLEVYTSANECIKRRLLGPDGAKQCNVYPGERIRVPTGMIFVLPKGFSLRVHPRSGIAYKQGLTLPNAEGVVDSDYREECWLVLQNISNALVGIQEGMRLAQGEIVPHYYSKETLKLVATTQEPETVGNRKGGHGSTGVY